MPFRTRRVFLWQWALGAFQLGMGWGNIWQPLTLKQSVQEAKECPKQLQNSEAKLQGTEKLMTGVSSRRGDIQNSRAASFNRNMSHIHNLKISRSHIKKENR